VEKDFLFRILGEKGNLQEGKLVPVTSIIIPNFNGRDLLQPCIASIKAHTHTPFEIIVIDSGSSDGSLELCRQERVKLISLPFNWGFTAACNYGLRIASGDALLLLNNDTIVTPGWLDNMLRCLYSAVDIGIVGPMTNYASGKQQIAEPFTDIDDMALRMNAPDDGKWLEVQRIAGFCFLFKREVLERVGLLDEFFTLDYCYRARLCVYRLLIAGDVFIYQHGGGGFQNEPLEADQQLIHQNHRKL
jgi:GT2 family glycosyltransferase